MGLFKKNKEEAFKRKMVTLQKFRPVFTTVDGNTHIGYEYNYGIANRLRCSVPEYMMIDIKSDGYLQDNCDVMYPLANIVSIDWQLVDEKEVEDKFSEYGGFCNIQRIRSVNMPKENKQSFIQIYSNDTFDVYYDKDAKKYHIDVFNDGHYWDEVRFDAYKEDELNPKEIPMQVERFKKYNHEWWVGYCPRCNNMVRFDFDIDSKEGNRKCHCIKCGQLCDFEDH